MNKILIYLIVVVPLLNSCQQKYSNPPYNEYEKKLREYPPEINRLVIPKDWLKMDSVTFLRFSNINKIIIEGDSIPKWITKMKSIKSIYAAYGKIKVMPFDINKLSDLEYLTIFSHSINDIPNSICDLHNLEFLSFWSNDIDNLPNCLFYLKKLTFLDLMDNHLTELSPEIIHLSRLEKLYLDGNRITELPESIYELKSLKEVSLGGNPLENPEEIKRKFEEKGIYIEIDLPIK